MKQKPSNLWPIWWATPVSFPELLSNFSSKELGGFVAELALALIALSFLYAHGGNFVRNALRREGSVPKRLHPGLPSAVA